MSLTTRRQFLGHAALLAAGTAAAVAPPPAPKVPPFRLTPIAGTPRDRGKAYGRAFARDIAAFLDREIYKSFVGKPSPKDAMLRYAAACGKELRAYSPEIHDEMEGLAEGAGLRLEEVVLLSGHEELWHRGVLPRVDHCTAVAVGPPDTADKHTYVGQTWDWMESVAGVATMLHWQREKGPSLLAYAFPGLWAGAGLNSAGLALTWTSAGPQKATPAIGIPAYALLTHLLYQESLADVVKEAKRAKCAGWFTFVMADGKGRLLNLEGSPTALAVEEPRGRLARVDFGSRLMTRTPAGQKVRYQARCQKMYDLIAADGGKVDLRKMQSYFAEPKAGISAGKATLDLMVYDTTAKAAYLSRGPSYGVRWQKFTFTEK